MKRKMLWKDIGRCFSRSKGRFFSICALVALGCFALVGLQVAGPDMRRTGARYFAQYHLADLTVLGGYGLDESDQAALAQAGGRVEFGYLKDVVVEGTQESLRVFSAPKEISQYELVSGRLPEAEDEIALAAFWEGKYALSDSISLEEKADAAGNRMLRHTTFRVVGFVHSVELLSSLNMGASTAGTGELKGYAVVTPEAFDSEVYAVARLIFSDTEALDPYSAAYRDRMQEHKDALEELLADAPARRLAAVKQEYQKKIDEAQEKLTNGKEQLSDAYQAIAEGEASLRAAKEDYAAAQTELSDRRSQVEAELAAAKAKLDAGRQEYEANRARLDKAKSDFAAADQELTENRKQLDAAWQQYEALAAQGAPEAQLAVLRAQLEEQEAQYAQASAQLDAQRALLMQQETALNAAWEDYQAGLSQWEEQKEQAQTALAAGEKELAAAAQEIAANEAKLNSARAEYEKEKPEADREILEAEQKVADAQAAVDGLSLPSYSVDTRREIPGSQGYRVYGTIAEIVDSLAGIFPIFLYFVAALVALTTMTRFVDEERTRSGTLKSLGYSLGDLLLKFSVYGGAAGLSGAVIGIAAGHTILPRIVYHAYAASFTYPPLELSFYPGVSLAAVAAALGCSVLPAVIVGAVSLREKPAELLRPKAPQAGSKILLEKIRPIWSRMSFTHKVTARNLFRYKKRMFMTIFGVCGAVSMLFTGFAVQHSISGIKERQFGEILRYDLIVAQNMSCKDAERAELDVLLADPAVASFASIHYETVYQTAGAHGDRQEIKLIVPEREEDLDAYIHLAERRSGKILSLEGGAVLSERLAQLFGVKEGDSLIVKDAQNREHSLVVSGITEMYTGHFIFMNASYYAEAFEEVEENAVVVRLTDRSAENANEQAGRFMHLNAVSGVVQNTTMMNQIDTIIRSLDRIMKILILIAGMLAAVILYNLTNINVSERLRELSTIKVLGFYDPEVTQYIYRETAILTLLGILAGFGIGEILFRYIIAVIPPDEVLFAPTAGWMPFVVPAIVVCLLTAGLGLLVHRRLKRVDMLEALKSVE